MNNIEILFEQVNTKISPTKKQEMKVLGKVESKLKLNRVSILVGIKKYLFATPLLFMAFLFLLLPIQQYSFGDKTASEPNYSSEVSYDRTANALEQEIEKSSVEKISVKEKIEIYWEQNYVLLFLIVITSLTFVFAFKVIFKR